MQQSVVSQPTQKSKKPESETVTDRAGNNNDDKVNWQQTPPSSIREVMKMPEANEAWMEIEKPEEQTHRAENQKNDPMQLESKRSFEIEMKPKPADANVNAVEKEEPKVDTNRGDANQEFIRIESDSSSLKI